MNAVRSLSHILRTFRRSPGFAAIATLSLGCGLGLTTAVFALMDGMTHPVSPIRDVDRTFEVRILGRAKLGPSRREYEAALAGIPGIARTATARWDYPYVEAGDAGTQMLVASVRPGFFDLLGIAPRLGRLPRADEATAENVALVSDALWKTRFGDRRTLDGATVTVKDHAYTVIGVLPFRSDVPRYADIWVPDPRPDDGGLGLVYARLRADVSQADVQAQLDAVFKRFTQQYTTRNERPWVAKLITLRPDPFEFKDYHRAVVGGAICVLLIACANVAALMLARGRVRTRDFALRLALGAGRGELAGDVIGEVVVLAVLGSIVGVMVAAATAGLITRSLPAELNWFGFAQPQWSWRVFALTTLAAAVSVAVAGGFPAWRASRVNPVEPLKESSGGTTTRAATRFRWLVIGELSVTMMLVMVATLMVKSAVVEAKMLSAQTTRERFSALFGGTKKQLPEAVRTALLNDALARVRAVPDVQSAALVSQGCDVDRMMVMTTDRSVEGGPAPFLPACTNVGAGFVAVQGWRIVEGRDFTDADRAGTGSLIVDTVTANRLFPGESAVGRMIKFGNMASTQPWLPIVGVVDGPPVVFGASSSVSPGFVRVYAALPMIGIPAWIEIRGMPGSTGVGLELGRIANSAMQGKGFVSVQSVEQTARQKAQVPRFLALIFSLLGVASLALGSAGLFSVISYIAMQRMREFAIRVALGSTRQGLLRLVFRDALVMSLGGTAFGAFAGMKAGFMLWDKMVGNLYPVDVGALVTAEVVLLTVTLLACLGPALRASRANPVEVMRAI